MRRKGLALLCQLPHSSGNQFYRKHTSVRGSCGRLLDSNFEGRKMRRCSSQVESWIQVLRQDDTDEDQISVIDSQDLVDKVDKEDKVKDQMDKLNMENMVLDQVDKTSQMVEDKIGLWDAARRGLLHKVQTLHKMSWTRMNL